MSVRWIFCRYEIRGREDAPLNRRYLTAVAPLADYILQVDFVSGSRLMAQRLSNREIAERLFLTEGSVKQYVKQIYSKLHIDGDTRTKRRRLNELLEAKA